MPGGFWNIIISTLAVYLFIVIAIRVFGKKELSQLSIVDLVFFMLISNAVQNAMVGPDTSLFGGLVAAATLFITNYLFKFLLYRFPKFGRLIQGEAILLVYKGKLNHSKLREAKLTMDELMEAIREHGVSTVEEVDLAVLEMDGNISVLSNEFQHQTIRERKLPKVEKPTSQE
ncbi:MAG TPA: YetF domain-containing protein [Bacillota bacterium]